MEERLKQRLTGAAILVALVVLIVPEMFQGRPASRPAQLPAAANGAPVVSYTLNLDEHGSSNAPTAAAAGGASPQALPAAVSNPEPARPPPADATLESAVPSGAAAPNAPSAAEHGVASESATPPPAHVSVPAAHTAAASAHSAAVAASAGKTGWTVQLGSFQQSDNAHRMAQKLAGKGVKTLVVGPDARGYYRVRTPEVADMASAQSLQQRLLQQGFKGVIGTTP